MKSSGSKTVSLKPDEVDRAVAGVQRAIEKLVQLMCRGDDDVVLKAVTALGHMGVFAARPVASAISAAVNPSHRMAMIVLLRTLVPAEYMDIALGLAAIAANDPDDRVRDMADELFHDMRTEARQLGRREPPGSQQGGDASDGHSWPSRPPSNPAPLRTGRRRGCDGADRRPGYLAATVELADAPRAGMAALDRCIHDTARSSRLWLT